MSNDEPDWTIRIPGSDGQRITERQEALLDRLERELANSRGGPLDASELEIRVSAIVRELAETGLAADQIADNSRLRPAFVRTLLAGGESPGVD